MMNDSKRTFSGLPTRPQQDSGANRPVADREPVIACADFADRLVDFSDGELPADESDAVASHVATCPGCRAELARLDASLAVLTSGITQRAGRSVPERPELLIARPSRALIAQGTERSTFSRLRWIVATAAIGLICAVSGWLITQRPHAALQPDRVAQVEPAPEPTPAPQRITRDDALWHIALLEQQARLQASLELMPRDESYAEQRRENERLLAKFQVMAASIQPGNLQ